MTINVGQKYVTNRGDIATCIELKPNGRYVFKYINHFNAPIIFDTDEEGKRYEMSDSPLNIIRPYDIEYQISIMAAYANGQKIEVNLYGKWIEEDNPKWDWKHEYYRVAKEPHKVPLCLSDLDERIEKNKTMWVRKDNESRRLIIRYNDNGVTFGSMNQNPLTLTYKEFMESRCVFLNGDQAFKTV